LVIADHNALRAARCALRSALEQLAPTHVAVAYLGYDWIDYLNIETLKEIIVSPTLGSNPYALCELLKVADERDIAVYFQCDLHAKVYIGEGGCLIGSANLSRNGFAGGLREAAVFLQDADSVQQALTVFEALRAGAVTNRKQQCRMIEKLVAKWQVARCHDVLPNEGGDRPRGTILDWKPGEERVWLAWIDPDAKPTLDEARIFSALPELADLGLAEHLDYVTLVEDDVIRKGDWLIVWVAKADGTPHLGRALYWLRVDALIHGGVFDGDEGAYTQLAATLPGSGNAVPPFEIASDAKVKRLINELLASREYPALLWSAERNPWRFADAVEDNQRFLADLRQAYLAETREK